MKIKAKVKFVKVVGQPRFFGKNNKKEVKFWGEEFKEEETKFPNILEFALQYDPLRHKFDITKSLSNYKRGDVLEFEFYLEGRTWTNPKTNEERNFSTNLVCSKINVVSSNATAANTPPPAEPSPDVSDNWADNTDDMPF